MFCGNKEKISDLHDRIVTVENVVGMNLPRIYMVERDIADLQQSVATLLHNQKPIVQGSATETQPSITADLARDAPLWKEPAGPPAPALPPATHRGPGALPKKTVGCLDALLGSRPPTPLSASGKDPPQIVLSPSTSAPPPSSIHIPSLAPPTQPVKEIDLNDALGRLFPNSNDMLEPPKTDEHNKKSTDTIKCGKLRVPA